VIPAAILISLVIVALFIALVTIFFQNKMLNTRIEVLEKENDDIIDHLIRNDGAPLQLKTRTRH